jgi:hypothetical protein
MIMEASLRQRIPLRLVLSKDLSLGMITEDLDIDEAAQVELLGSEHGHDGGNE